MKSRKFRSGRVLTRHPLIEAANYRKQFLILYVFQVVIVTSEAAIKRTRLILPASHTRNAGSRRRIKEGRITFSETRFAFNG
jgi:hypothetical protein